MSPQSDPSLASSRTELAALLGVVPPPEPSDFSAFWRETFTQARAVPPATTTRPSSLPVDHFTVEEIEFSSFGGLRIRGWLMVPRTHRVTRGLVISHGYGGRDGPDTLPLLPDAAMIFPCARGLSLSRIPGIPAESSAHVLHGISSRETYVHRGCAADVWAAASALIERVPATAARLDYVGTSFGGGIGALALPWDDRFQSAFLGLPSFGHHPLRLATSCSGSGEAVRQYAGTHPGIADVLRYFDASLAARHLRIPVLVAAAIRDPMVPPAGQFAIYNALPPPRELLVLQAGHEDWPGAAAEEEKQRAALIRFLNQSIP